MNWAIVMVAAILLLVTVDWFARARRHYVLVE